MERGDSADVNLGISAEEFEHYQQRTLSEKYALLEKVRKLEQENARFVAEKSSESDLDKILKDKFQKPFQNLLSRSKRDSESDSSHHHENDALQKRLLSQEEDFQRQNTLLMQELQHLVAKNEELESRLKPLLFSQSRSANHNDQDSDSQTLIKSLQAELQMFRNAAEKATERNEDSQVPTEENVSESSLQTAYQQIAFFTKEIATLKQKLKSDQLDYQQKVQAQERTVESLVKDLEAKQTSVTLLLSEKDQLQKNFAEKSSILIAEKESLKTAFRFDLDAMKQENAKLVQEMEDDKMIAKTRIDDVERQMKDLLEQLDVTSHQTKRDQDELLSEHKKQIATLMEQVESLSTAKSALEKQNAAQAASLQSLNEERSRLIVAEAGLGELAEKRKATIEDLTTHLEKMKAEHGKELEDLKRDTDRCIKDRDTRLVHANEEIMRLGDINATLEKNSHHLTSLQREHERFKQESLDQLCIVEEAKEALRFELETLRTETATKMEDLNIQLRDTTTVLMVANAEKDSLSAQLAKHLDESGQSLHDKNEEIRILDRKNAGTLRDLQKQLQSEKKRVEKLQNRLNEVLKETGIKPRHSGEETDFTEREETGSNASWSFVSPKSGGRKQTDGSVHSNQDHESVMTDQEARELVGRVAKLQQEKSALMERVLMLETGNAAMAEDLLNKSTIIDRYLQQAPIPGHVQHGKDEMFSLKKVIDHLGRDKSIDAETQKNLRRLLEETLTKNIHLQKNMELLSEELDRLRGSSPPR